MADKPSKIKQLVLDVLKPHKPSIHLLAQQLVELEGSGILGVNVTLLETDRSTQSIKITIRGENLNFEMIAEKLEEMNAAVHSIDQVVCGDILVEDVKTPQDRGG
ncbi:MAG: DUF211 domain-containing protein [Promethearchaeota archaeon]